MSTVKITIAGGKRCGRCGGAHVLIEMDLPKHPSIPMDVLAQAVSQSMGMMATETLNAVIGVLLEEYPLDSAPQPAAAPGETQH